MSKLKTNTAVNLRNKYENAKVVQQSDILKVFLGLAGNLRDRKKWPLDHLDLGSPISGYLSHGFPAPEAPEVRPVSYSRPGQFAVSAGPAGTAMVSPKTWPWATHGNTWQHMATQLLVLLVLPPPSLGGPAFAPD